MCSHSYTLPAAPPPKKFPTSNNSVLKSSQIVCPSKDEILITSCIEFPSFAWYCRFFYMTLWRNRNVVPDQLLASVLNQLTHYISFPRRPHKCMCLVTLNSSSDQPQVSGLAVDGTEMNALCQKTPLIEKTRVSSEKRFDKRVFYLYFLLSVFAHRAIFSWLCVLCIEMLIQQRPANINYNT